VRGEDDGFAQVEQCPCGVRPDGTQAAGDEDHRRRTVGTVCGSVLDGSAILCR
jgi:hypothetical protein